MAEHSHVAHKETHQTFRNIDTSKIRMVNGRVLCKRITKNAEGSVNGIHYPTQYHENQRLYQNADRVYEVVVAPSTMREERWLSDVQIEPGDIVWVEVIDALNAPEIQDGDDEYRILKYQSLIVAKRNGKVIPLNGNVILSNMYTKIKTGLGANFEVISEPAIIYPLARVEWAGKQNKYYVGTDDSDKNIKVKKGDVVVLDLPNKNTATMSRKYIEEGMFAMFDEEHRYFYEQRRSIMGVLEN